MIATVAGKQYLTGNKQNLPKWNSTINRTYYEMGFRGRATNSLVEDFICTLSWDPNTCSPQLGACNQQTAEMW